MPLSKITDTSEIKNDINGFDLVECYSQGKSKLYISFPNLGAGMLAQMAAASNPEISGLEVKENYTYKPIFPSARSEEMFTNNKETQFKPYSGLTREMFITSVDMSTGCSNSISLGNTINVCTPWKIYNTKDLSLYLNNTERAILSGDFKMTDPDNTIKFDYYMNTFKTAMDVLHGNSGKAEELMDGIVASVIRYATAGVDHLDKETEIIGEYEDILSQYPPETKWARPLNTTITQYDAKTERAEYTDLFPELRDKNIYFNKLDEGNQVVNINDIFVKPCVLFGIEDGINNRLFYSKTLSDMIINNITIEGATTPPLVEYNRVINIYGYDAVNTPPYINKLDISSMSSDLGIELEDFDNLTGSGFYIKEHMIDICKDTQSIQALDWGEAAFTGAMIDSGLVLTTPRPPVFSMGEAYIDNDKPDARLPFYYSYILPSDVDGYISEDYFPKLDFMGWAYYHAEGYDNLISITRDYLNYLQETEELVKQQAPVLYPPSKMARDIAKELKSWRLYSTNMATITDGFISGRPSGPNFNSPFINNINNGTIPTIDVFRLEDAVQMPDPADLGSEEYNQDLIKYAEYTMKLANMLEQAKRYRELLYQYIGPATNVVYDYTMYPIIISDNATMIKAHGDDVVKTTAKPDKGVSLNKAPNETFKSMSADPLFMDIGSDGVISLSNLLKRTSTAGKYSQYIGNISTLIETNTKNISKLQTMADKYILTLDDTILLSTGDNYPIFSNSKCSITEAIKKPYISELLISNMMYIYETSNDNELFPDINSMIQDMVRLWSTESGSLMRKLMDDSNEHKGSKIKLYADNIRNSVIAPMRALCYLICTSLCKRSDNNYFMYYKNSYNNERGTVLITPDTQNLGTWFYNTRKTYLIIMSFITFIQSICDGIDNYLVAVLKDYIPTMIDMESGVKDNDGFDVPVTSTFDSFAFMNNSAPLYPILLADININEIPQIRLNHVSSLSSIPETFIYNIKINIKETSEVNDVMAVMMPGFGIRNGENEIDDHTTNQYFWNDRSIFTWSDEYNTINSPFAYLQNGISHDDFIKVEDGNMQAITYGGSTAELVKVQSSDLKQAIITTSEELPEIQNSTVSGIIDAGFIFPFYDKMQSLRTTAENMELKYNGMNPNEISGYDATTFSQLFTLSSIDDTISYLINASQMRPVAPLINDKVFGISKDQINEQLKVILQKLIFIMTPEYIKVLSQTTDKDTDISITTISHSFARSASADTNTILQGYLLTKFNDNNINNTLMTEENIALEINSSGDWKSFQNTDPAISKHSRNFNIYLSKRRSHYSTYLLFLMLLQNLIALEYPVVLTNPDEITVSIGDHSVKFVIANSKPAGQSYKLFNSYGFGGLFFNIDTNPNRLNEVQKDISESIRSQMQLSTSKKKARVISVQASTNNRADYVINLNEDGKTGTVKLPDNCLLFPTTPMVINNKKAPTTSSLYSITAQQLGVNFGIGAKKASEIYTPSNIAQAKEKASQFINNHIDAFKIDSFIDKIWVIID